MMGMMGYDEYYDDEYDEEVGECCSYPGRRINNNASFQEFRFIQAVRIPPHKRTVQVRTFYYAVS
jgi:hypothetical protein